MYMFFIDNWFTVLISAKLFVFIRVETYPFDDMFVFIHLRNARKKKETNSQVNEVDMYDLTNTKPGKNYLK